LPIHINHLLALGAGENFFMAVSDHVDVYLSAGQVVSSPRKQRPGTVQVLQSALATMAEGNPMLILEKGEKVVMPPAIWIQGRPDMTHDYHDPDGGFAGNEPERFVSNYRKAGGDIEITYFDNEKRNTDVTHAPVVEFLKKHVN